MHDEGMQLKTLQTALTLLQSPDHAHLEVPSQHSTTPSVLVHVQLDLLF